MTEVLPAPGVNFLTSEENVMAQKDAMDLRDILIDAHAHFFFLKEAHVQRLRLWQVLPDGIVIDRPFGAPMRKTVLGYIPTLDGSNIYEIEGFVSVKPMAEQMQNTIRLDINPVNVKKVNRRLYPRHNFTPPLAGTATPEGSKSNIPIMIVNFSAGGLRVETKSKLEATRIYTFRFRIETEEEVHDIALPGRIVYELPAETGCMYGVKFKQRAGKEDRAGEAPVEALDQTVDLLGLVNRLLVREA